MSGQSVILNIEIIRDRISLLDQVHGFCSLLCFRRNYLKYLNSRVNSLALSSRTAPIQFEVIKICFIKTVLSREFISGIHANKLLEAVV